MELRKLIKLKDETKEMNCSEVYEQFKNYIYKTAIGFLNTGETLEDLIQISNIGLVKAFNTYKFESENLFMTYMAIVVNNQVLMHLRKIKKFKKETSYDNYISTDSEGKQLTLLEKLKDPIIYEDVVLDNMENLKIKALVERLNPKKREIIKSFYFSNMNQTEIGEKFNLSQSYMSRLIKESLRILKKRYEWG